MAILRKQRLNLRPIISMSMVVICFFNYVSICSSLPNPDLAEDFKTNKVVTFEQGGKTYELSTRDIILIAVAGFLAFLIIVCLIGYCFCECVKSLLCCIFCCDC